MPNKESIFGSVWFHQDRPPTCESIFGSVIFNQAGQWVESIFGEVNFQDSCHGYGQEEIDLCLLAEIECADGSVARFTDYSKDIEFESHTWQAIPMRRGALSIHSGLQVDQTTLDMGIVGVKVGDRFLSVPQIVRRDLLRGARVRLWTYDFVLQEKKYFFDGLASSASGLAKGLVSLNVGCILDKLQEKFPKIIYSEMCNHVVYDSRCGLNKSDWDDSGTIGSGSLGRVIYSTIFAYASHAAGWFHRGEIKITDVNSLNYGISRSIIEHGDGYVKTTTAFPDPLVVGETIIAYAGCDRTGVTCTTKFNNYANFFGFEYIPKPETLLGTIG